jgi:hypothetical protein
MRYRSQGYSTALSSCMNVLHVSGKTSERQQRVLENTMKQTHGCEGKLHSRLSLAGKIALRFYYKQITSRAPLKFGDMSMPCRRKHATSNLQQEGSRKWRKANIRISAEHGVILVFAATAVLSVPLVLNINSALGNESEVKRDAKRVQRDIYIVLRTSSKTFGGPPAEEK